MLHCVRKFNTMWPLYICSQQDVGSRKKKNIFWGHEGCVYLQSNVIGSSTDMKEVCEYRNMKTDSFSLLLCDGVFIWNETLMFAAGYYNKRKWFNVCILYKKMFSVWGVDDRWFIAFEYFFRRPIFNWTEEFKIISLFWRALCSPYKERAYITHVFTSAVIMTTATSFYMKEMM